MIKDYRIIREKADWDEILKKFEKKDIFFEYYYFDLHTYDGDEPILVYMETENGKMAYPFMLRDISYDDNFNGKLERGKYFDIGTPNGYIGHLVESSDTKAKALLIEEFYSKFGEFCKEKNIVSEFIKFSPFLGNHKYMESVLEVSYMKKLVTTELQDYGDPVYGEVKTRKRKEAEKCRKLGMKTVFEKAPKSCERQRELYYAAMKRKHASDYYLFSENYFEKMLGNLSDNILMMSTYLDDKIIAFELCFIYDRFMHGYLAATDEDYIAYSPNTLSNIESMSWGHRNGYKYLCLGGGLTNAEDDSLYLYKKAFAKNTDLDLYLGKKIWNSEAYDYLLSLIKLPTNCETDFFPKYRMCTKFY